MMAADPIANRQSPARSDFHEFLMGRLSAKTTLSRDEPLARRTTLRVGGNADFYVEPADESDLATVLRAAASFGIPYFILGRGSNIIVRDGGFRGVVICLAQSWFSRIEVSGQQMRCGAGARLKLVAVEARRQGIAGLEFLEGIPGTIGGALRMNAGAMNGATFDLVKSVRVMDGSGNTRDLAARDMAVAYRSCDTLKNLVALEALLAGCSAPVTEIEQRMAEYSRKRWSSQPAALSAGCMFKNAITISAGRLIDEVGLKGTRIGGAVVAREHGNFIINDGKATAREVLDLICLVKEKVKEKRGIELHTEVEVIGED
jgi:UDP-N-acetylenolpyruvoylglucosamine reductase